MKYSLELHNRVFLGVGLGCLGNTPSKKVCTYQKAFIHQISLICQSVNTKAFIHQIFHNHQKVYSHQIKIVRTYQIQIVKTHQIVDPYVELVPISSFSFWGAFHRCTVDQTIHLRIRALIEIRSDS